MVENSARSFGCAVPTAEAWADAVGERIEEIAADFVKQTGISGPAYEEFMAPLTSLTSGGKRLRAALVRVGALCVRPDVFAGSTQGQRCALGDAAVNFGAAIELFQAAALAHDDIIDKAPTRRGNPSAHAGYSDEHREAGYLFDGAHYGASAAIVGGDYLLSLAFIAADGAPVDETLTADALAGARQRFAAMCAQVAYGQYLDIRAEHLPWDHAAALSKEAAMEVMLHKSATYSVTQPALLGATLAGAEAHTLALLAEALTPLGLAFQMRDDMLGVFGDPQVTGKPAGGDLSEGKRTVLLALANENLRANGRDEDAAWLLAHVGSAMSEAEIARAQDMIASCGAVQAHEKLISELTEQARAGIAAAPISEEGRAALAELASRLTERSF